MTDESVLDEMLSAGDYEIVMCVLFAEVLAGEMPEQYRNLRMEALMHLRSVLAQYQKRMYHDKLLSGIASKKGKMILKATSKAEISRILHPQAPHFDGGKFIPNEYCVTEEELIAWSEASLKGPLLPLASERYGELFREVFPEEAESLSNTDDPRLREIVKNLESLKIGVDEPFRFHCTMCGKCCTNREDILLTPKDLFYISKELKKTPEDVVKEFCETYIGSASRFPIVRLYPIGYDKHCPLLNGNKCSVHAVKPVVCAMFPIGRVLQGSADGPKPEEVTSDSVQYIFVKPGCGDDSETHTVREWFGEFGIPMEDEFFVKWQRTLSAASSAIRRFEKGFSPETMNAIWSVVFGLTYLNYDTEQDFTEQFSDNAAKVMKLISMAEGAKGQS